MYSEQRLPIKKTDGIPIGTHDEDDKKLMLKNRKAHILRLANVVQTIDQVKFMCIFTKIK